MTDTALINPDKIPGADVDEASISEVAASFAKLGRAIRRRGSKVIMTWNGISQHYDSPDAQQLFDAMLPVGGSTTTVGDMFETVGGILADFVEDIHTPLIVLGVIRTESQQFVDQVSGGVKKEVPEVRSRTGGTYTTTTPWNEDPDASNLNRTYVDAVSRQVAKLDEARVRAVNRIDALRTDRTLKVETAVTFDDLDDDGLDLPWGRKTYGERTCMDGFATTFVGGFQSIGTLTVGYNATTNKFWDDDYRGQAWRGIGMTVAAATGLGPALTVMATNTNLLPKDIDDFYTEAGQKITAAGKGFVAWDDWRDSPGYAAGEVITNVGTLALPTKGGGAALKALIGSEKAVSVGYLARVVEVNPEIFTGKTLTLAAKDFITAKGKAFFWSGRTGEVGGKDVAAAVAAQEGGVTLEQWMLKRGVKMPVWDPDVPSSLKAWDDASRLYAQGASGKVRVVLGESGIASKTSTWGRVEFDALKENPNVSRITAVDPATGKTTVLWKR